MDLLELVEINPVPRQKTLPSMLAVVLVDERHVVVAARIFRPAVERIHSRKANLQLSPTAAASCSRCSCAGAVRRAGICTGWPCRRIRHTPWPHRCSYPRQSPMWLCRCASQQGERCRWRFSGSVSGAPVSDPLRDLRDVAFGPWPGVPREGGGTARHRTVAGRAWPLSSADAPVVRDGRTCSGSNSVRWIWPRSAAAPSA